MNTIYEGKTKNLVEEDGKYFCLFKDTMTGTDGVFDTGGNQVAGEKEGAGQECLKVSKFFFEKINEAIDSNMQVYFWGDIDLGGFTRTHQNTDNITVLTKEIKLTEMYSFWKRFRSYYKI